MNEDRYVFRVSCNNCHTENNLSIPKGVRVQTYVVTATCAVCGCKLREERMRHEGEDRVDYSLNTATRGSRDDYPAIEGAMYD